MKFISAVLFTLLSCWNAAGSGVGSSVNSDSPNRLYALRTQIVENYGFSSDPIARVATVTLLHQNNILWIESTDLGMYDFGSWYASAIWAQDSSAVLVIQRITRSQVVADLVCILPAMQKTLTGKLDFGLEPTLEIKRFDSDQILRDFPKNGPAAFIVYFKDLVSNKDGMQFSLIAAQEKKEKFLVKVILKSRALKISQLQ